MLFAVICKDKPDHLHVRLDTRAVDLDYFAEQESFGWLEHSSRVER